MAVYLFKDRASGLYKIGWSINPQVRENTLAGTIPLIEMVNMWNDTVRRDESKLHAIFRDKRVRGEWFNLTADDIAAIDSYLTIEMPIAKNLTPERKPTKLSTDDLRAIIEDRITPEVEGRLILWAIDELKRRERAGKLGGRPKGKKPGDTPKTQEPERKYEPFNET